MPPVQQTMHIESSPRGLQRLRALIGLPAHLIGLLMMLSPLWWGAVNAHPEPGLGLFVVFVPFGGLIVFHGLFCYAGSEGVVLRAQPASVETYWTLFGLRRARQTPIVSGDTVCVRAIRTRPYYPPFFGVYLCSGERNRPIAHLGSYSSLESAQTQARDCASVVSVPVVSAETTEAESSLEPSLADVA